MVGTPLNSCILYIFFNNLSIWNKFVGIKNNMLRWHRIVKKMLCLLIKWCCLSATIIRTKTILYIISELSKNIYLNQCFKSNPCLFVYSCTTNMETWLYINNIFVKHKVLSLQAMFSDKLNNFNSLCLTDIRSKWPSHLCYFDNDE